MCVLLPVILASLGNKDKEHCRFFSLNSVEGEAQICEIKRNQELKLNNSFWVIHMQSRFTAGKTLEMENGFYIKNNAMNSI